MKRTTTESCTASRIGTHTRGYICVATIPKYQPCGQASPNVLDELTWDSIERSTQLC